MPTPVGREQWSPEERALIDATPAKWARRPKLTPDQVKAIRARVDSLTVPWTLQELAAHFGVTPGQIAKIARRQKWPERAFEPDNAPYWREEQDAD